jgi:DNA-3-methyladenine glycosylase II
MGRVQGEKGFTGHPGRLERSMGKIAMVGRIIDGPEDLAEGAGWLVRREPRFGPVLAEVGPLPLRRTAPGFAALLDIVMAQQVSVASAEAIGRRLADAGLTEAGPVARASEDELRACGLSRQKIRYALALARSGTDFDSLARLPDAEVIAALDALPGIGPWTAEIYAMFALGRADVFAPGDLALQEAARLVFALDERPGEKVLRAMAADWSPWRAVAARALWAYYRVRKNREGVT